MILDGFRTLRKLDGFHREAARSHRETSRRDVSETSPVLNAKEGGLSLPAHLGIDYRGTSLIRTPPS